MRVDRIGGPGPRPAPVPAIRRPERPRREDERDSDADDGREEPARAAAPPDEAPRRRLDLLA